MMPDPFAKLTPNPLATCQRVYFVWTCTCGGRRMREGMFDLDSLQSLAQRVQCALCGMYGKFKHAAFVKGWQ